MNILFQKLFDVKQKKKAIIILILSIIISFMEAAGVGAVLPFITILQNPSTIEEFNFLKNIINFFGFYSNEEMIFIMGVILLLIFLIKNFLAYIFLRSSNNFTQDFFRRLSKRLLSSYIRQPFVFFLNQNSAILAKNVTTETKLIAEQIIQPALLIVSEGLVLIAILIVLMLYNPILSIISLLVVSILLSGVYYLSSRYSKYYGTVREQTLSYMAKLSIEALSGIKDIKVSGTEKFFIDTYDVYTKKHAKATSLNNILQQLPRIVIETFLITSILGIILFFINSNSLNSEIVATLAMYLVAAYRLMPSVNRIMNSIMRLRYIEAGFMKIYKSLQDVLIEEDEQDKFVSPISLEKTITLSNVSFSYPQTSKDVLRGINLAINKGDLVGFIGDSGAGKSTLVNIILGLLQPEEGEIIIDNNVLIDKKIKSWQSSIAYVPQNVFIADDSLANNIALGIEAKNINIKKINEIIKICKLEDLVKDMPQGIDTLIGERGTRLSGGQIQRIAIARALYRDASILVLDEATSALDNITEANIIEAIIKSSENKTILMIAHRYSTLKYCNKIYELKDGQISKSINYQELINTEM